PQGRFLRQFGGPDRRDGAFAETFGLAVGPTGDVYVLDDQRPGVVTRFSPSGKIVWQGGGGASPQRDLTGHLHPAGLDGHGRLVMVNDDLGRVVYLDRNGHEVDAFATPGCDVTVDAAGNTYVTGCARGTVVFDPAHRRIGEWASRALVLRASPRF